MPTTQEVLHAYEAAWTAPDGATRRHLLEQCLTEDAVVIGPNYAHAGREAFAQALDQIRERLPTAHIVLTGVQEQQGFLCVKIEVVASDEQRWPVVDFGELAPDGRLQRIVVFRDSPPEHAA